MKLFSIFLLFAFYSIQSQNFEGELNYSVKMDGFTIYKSDTLKFKEIKAKMIKKGQYFDSLNIKIKDLGYIKKINNGKNKIERQFLNEGLIHVASLKISCPIEL
jgi:hypothetical protein